MLGERERENTRSRGVRRESTRSRGVRRERESTRSRCVRREREIGQTQLGVSAFTAMQRGWEGEREH